MIRRVALSALLICTMTCIGNAEDEGGMRELTPEEIPPNLNYYAMDPLYDPNAILGWAEKRIEEKINRGMLALNIGNGNVYLGWRLLKSDPEDVAFNVYRTTDGGPAIKLNSAPVTRTTDFIDDSTSPDKTGAWFVKPVVRGREQAASEQAALEANAPVRQYKSIPLRDDVQSVAMVAIGDLDGDGVYDFVVNHPGQGSDQGRTGPNIGSYKYDGYNGRDEIINGSLAIDNDGKTMWGTGLGHGDRSYMGDIDPDRPGWEIWYTIEEPHPRNGASMVDARTGMIIFGADEPNGDNELGSCMAADIDPDQPGLELAGGRFYYSSTGRRLSGPVPPQGLMAWWDADLLREFVGRRGLGKWKGGAQVPLDGTPIEGMVHQVADILGDWREELVTATGGELRIYSTTIFARDRRVCLMQDPLYRNDVCHHTMGYTNRHYPMPGYYLGTR